ncbi:MAG: hypothetical protein NC117_09990 [Pseudoflavonifractor sp.]|nr:hypothetical protein [Pseudoflavonifractor sp.]
MGVALGVIGLNLDDFMALTPEEFAAVWQIWSDRSESANRDNWERTRLECCCILQPYTSGTLRPVDVMRFPWDSQAGSEGDKAKVSAPELTREQLMERYRQTKADAGLS